MTERMRDVSHTHPDHDPRDWHWFRRGPVVAADGGRPGDRDTDDDDRVERPGRDIADRDVADERMSDVSHTPPQGDGANRVWDGTRVYDEDDGATTVHGEDTDDDE